MLYYRLAAQGFDALLQITALSKMLFAGATAGEGLLCL